MGDVQRASASVVGAGSIDARLNVRYRLIVWLALPAAMVVYALVLSWSSSGPLRSAMLATIYVTPIVLTVVLALLTAARVGAPESRFWLWLALANTPLFLCEALLLWWVAVIDPAGPPRVSPPFHLLHGVAAIGFGCALISMTRLRSSTLATRLRVAIDGLVIGLATALLLLVLYVRPVMEAAGASSGEIVLGLAYPLAGALMLLGTAANVLGFKMDRWRAWDRLFAASLVLYGVGVALWPAWFATAAEGSRNVERGLLDFVQLGGHWMLMAAAFYRLTATEEWALSPLPPISSRRSRTASFVPPLLVVAAIPLTTFSLYTTPAAPGVVVMSLGLLLAAVLLLGSKALLIAEGGQPFEIAGARDTVTGLPNASAFKLTLAEELTAAARFGEEVALIVFDIDGLSNARARLGSAASDELLNQISGLLGAKCGRDCAVFRLRRDVFSVIAPRTPVLEAEVLARRSLDAISIEGGLEPGSITASAGIAVYPADADQAQGLIVAAERAVMRAKRVGGDQVSVRG